MGILTFLRNALGIPPSKPPPNGQKPNQKSAQVEIFGPRGIRRMLRTIWNATRTRSEHPYVVHELLFPGEEPSIAAEVQGDEGVDVEIRHDSERIGLDIWCDEQGFWRSVVDISRQRGGVIVDAGPIQHRDPCIGYIIREIPNTQQLHPLSSRLPRKLAILGDTFDPTRLIPLIHADPPFASVLPVAEDPCGTGHPVRIPVTLLVHEATDAYIPPSVDPQGRIGRNRTKETVEAKAVERGHSTPGMAGAFAREIAAERLVLNHIGARFPAASESGNRGGPQAQFRRACIREIERQAAETWCPTSGVQPQAAWDYFSLNIPPNRLREPNVLPQIDQSQSCASVPVAAADGITGVAVGVDVIQNYAFGLGGSENLGQMAGPSSARAQVGDAASSRRRGRNQKCDKASPNGVGSQSTRASESDQVSSEHGRSQRHKGKPRPKDGEGGTEDQYVSGASKDVARQYSAPVEPEAH